MKNNKRIYQEDGTLKNPCSNCFLFNITCGSVPCIVKDCKFYKNIEQ